LFPNVLDKSSRSLGNLVSRATQCHAFKAIDNAMQQAALAVDTSDDVAGCNAQALMMLAPCPPHTPTGQTAYTVKASGSSTSVSTADAPDSPPLSLAQASAQAATAAVLGADLQGDMQASLRSGPMAGSNVLRTDHSFNKDDHLFRVRRIVALDQ
jgi:hypothetical protein